MGIIRDNNPAKYDSLYTQSDKAKNEAIHAAEMATVAASEAYKKYVWTRGLIIVAAALILTFILSITDHTVWAVIVLIVGGVAAVYSIKSGLDNLVYLNARSNEFTTKIYNYR